MPPSLVRPSRVALVSERAHCCFTQKSNPPARPAVDSATGSAHFQKVRGADGAADPVPGFRRRPHSRCLLRFIFGESPVDLHLGQYALAAAAAVRRKDSVGALEEDLREMGVEGNPL